MAWLGWIIILFIVLGIALSFVEGPCKNKCCNKDMFGYPPRPSSISKKEYDSMKAQCDFLDNEYDK